LNIHQFTKLFSGKLSPTSSHLFKLILPLGHLSAQQTAHNGSKENPVPPTVFLLHPSQPLSHVSRLISASLAPSTPTIAFRSAPNADWDKQAFQWSDATDVGDFVRDAARATEFIIHIANARVSEASKDSGPSNAEIVVDVPTFTDRTRFLRRQLEVIGDEMKGMEGLKLMCDREAHRGARRLAVSGFFGLVVYWGTVARLTFWDLGWWVAISHLGNMY
jgi:calcium uniporter protein, mitochondrial